MNASMIKKWRRRLLLTFCALIAWGLIACHPGRKPQQQRYELKGKVVSVDGTLHQATIAHEAIPGFMSAMTMTFTVKDDDALRWLAAQDQVTAILVVQGDRSWLEDLVITKGGAAEATSGGKSSAREPRIGEEVPDFSLVNQDAKPIHLHRYRGKALLLTFIYTRCPLPDYCPLMSHYFDEISQELKKDLEQYKATHLLSISIDPNYDKPAVLRLYGSSYTRDFAHWEFASGQGDCRIFRLAVLSERQSDCSLPAHGAHRS